MKIKAKVFRFDPTTDKKPRYDVFEVPHEDKMRVLGVLNYIRENYDSTLAYRYSCRARRCGTCAVNVNGLPKVACWDEAQENMVIEPQPNLPVVRDLVVDRTGYDDLTDRLGLTLNRNGNFQFPEKLDLAEHFKLYEFDKCIECLICISVCPAFTGWSHFGGPAPIVLLSRFNQDPRDGMDRVAEALDTHVFDCMSCYACQQYCPQEIKIVDHAIDQLKRKALARGLGPEARYVKAFLTQVKGRGLINPAVLFMKAKGVGGLVSLPKGLKMIMKGKLPLRGAKVPYADSEEIRRIYEEVNRKS